jgi:aromatic amino acid aminotransferase I
MITKLMLEWGYDGYIRWLRGIKATYAMRRDWMVSPGRSVLYSYDDPV